MTVAYRYKSKYNMNHQLHLFLDMVWFEVVNDLKVWYGQQSQSSTLDTQLCGVHTAHTVGDVSWR